MKAWFVSAAGLALLWNTPAVAAPKNVKPSRTVELISLRQKAGQRTEEPAHLDQGGAIEGVGQDGISSPFRLNDLSRRWVEYQMGSALTGASLSVGEAEAQNPRGDVRRASPLPPMSLWNQPSSIEIPGWMRTGGVLKGPASSYVPGCATVPYRPTGFLRPDAEFRRASYYRMMSGIACEYGVPVGLFDAMIIQESRYRHAIFSPKNAFGLTQLMPQTALALGVDRYNVEGNLRGGAKYLRDQLDRFGHYHLALAAYNAGPGRVRGGRVPQIPETQGYVGNVLANWSRIAGLDRRGVTFTDSAPEAAAPYAGSRVTVSTF